MSSNEDHFLDPMKLRKRAKLTQRQVAQALDIRQSTVSDWERGLSIPHLPPSKLKLMMEVYRCTIDELIEAFEDSKKRQDAEDFPNNN